MVHQDQAVICWTIIIIFIFKIENILFWKVFCKSYVINISIISINISSIIIWRFVKHKLI